MSCLEYQRKKLKILDRVKKLLPFLSEEAMDRITSNITDGKTTLDELEDVVNMYTGRPYRFS